ncbi:aminoglycoside phosphotransferase [Streptomyces sp. H27-H1]|uniref:aminoglycoside phosphotransferase n=1 Tax=Streptomyces sp. H27-H1 TaxID=2996461 RepID=UPI00226E001B|nr:aminoglycoside phosphotransferase [Streptomyces sp. H27-H1]MCY0931518.1 aminoglycoside phosphotransferase [Streptomyces sp. H27-H1]
MELIEAQTGPVLAYESVGAGLNSAVAARVRTADTTVFVKGLPRDHRRVWTQQREADIAPSVHRLAPNLLWHVQEAGWDLLAFTNVNGHHADYAPGSPDLPLVADAMTRLSSITASGIDLRSMPDRMTAYSETPELFHGTALLHTDWFPSNVLVGDDGAVLVDWAWASRGAAWIDPALWVVWLIKSGHTPQEAEGWAARIPSWTAAPPTAVTAFAQATAAVWEEIAEGEQATWVLDMLQAALTWRDSR